MDAKPRMTDIKNAPTHGTLKSDKPSLDALVRAQQVRTVYRNLPMVLMANIAIPIVLALVLYGATARWLMVPWLAATFGVVVLRAGLSRAYWRTNPPSSEAAVWGRYFAFGALVSGSLWGAAGTLLAVPEAPAQFSFIVMVLAGLGAASVISYAAYLPAFYAYFLPSLLPFVGAAFLGDADIQRGAALATLVYVGALSFFAHNLHKVFAESMRLRFENIGLVKDLTLQKETAERANAAKTRFLAAASHDLRQPLHALGLFVSALNERVRGETTRKLVAQIGASADALRGLLNALLDISRLDAGVIHPRVTHCSVQSLFDRLAHDHAAAAGEKGIRLKFIPTNTGVCCDTTLLERIVGNLVSNAIRYTDRGGVVVGCRRRGGRLCIEVWDSGIGIAADELENIFHEFHQIGNPERDRSKGLGLGLAIAGRLARLLESRINVVSVPGKGSVFSLVVPRSYLPATYTASPTDSKRHKLGSMLVTVIDDERAIREAMHTLLSGWGCVTVLADSADAALATLAVSERAPDVIIADYRLRDNRIGVDAIMCLQARYGSDIPAIVITGDTAPERLREAQASGYRLLHKPLAPAKLRSLLNHIALEGAARAGRSNDRERSA